MKFLLPWVLFVGCATPSWVVPQPTFTTKDPADALVRIAASVQARCGGVKTVNEESGIVIGNWGATPHDDGVVLTQCIVSVLNGDDQVRDVRLTFAVRHCPKAADTSNLDALAQTCARETTVPEALHKQLQLIGERLEGDVSRR